MYRLRYQFRRLTFARGSVSPGRWVYKTFSTHAEREEFTEQLLKDGCYRMESWRTA